VQVSGWFLKEQGYTVIIVNLYHVKNAEKKKTIIQEKRQKDSGIIADLVKTANSYYPAEFMLTSGVLGL